MYRAGAHHRLALRHPVSSLWPALCAEYLSQENLLAVGCITEHTQQGFMKYNQPPCRANRYRSELGSVSSGEEKKRSAIADFSWKHIRHVMPEVRKLLSQQKNVVDVLQCVLQIVL